MKKLILVSLALMMFIGCSSSNKGVVAPTSSGSKPKWVKTESDIDKNFLYIKASAVGNDRNFLKEVAIKSNARSAIASYIFISAQEELDQGIVGSLGGSSGSYGKALQNSLVRAKFAGMLLRDPHWENIGRAGNSTEYE